MRYYAIKFDKAPPSFPVVPGALVSGAHFSSVAYNQNDPGALRCVLQCEGNNFGEAIGGGNVRIYGVSLAQLSQSSDLNGVGIEVYGGMFRGLPLATAEYQKGHSGLIYKGHVYAGFGNWERTDMTLDLILSLGGGPGSSSTSPIGGDTQPISGVPFSGSTPPPAILGPGGGGARRLSGGAPPSRLLTRRLNPAITLSRRPTATPRDFFGNVVTGALDLAGILGEIAGTYGGGGYAKKPTNLVHDMQPNQWLGDAIKKTLSTAYPNVNLIINISQNLKLPYQDSGFYQSMQQYAMAMRQLSHAILGTTNYMGVQMWAHGNDLHVDDKSKPQTNIVKIDYESLIGQPTWIAPSQIIVKTVMRADVDKSKTINLPSQLQTSLTPDALLGEFKADALPNLITNFSGNWQIDRILHVGDSRHPDGAMWCTNIWATNPQAQSGQNAGNATTTNSNLTYDVNNPPLPPPRPSNLLRLSQRRVRRYG